MVSLPRCPKEPTTEICDLNKGTRLGCEWVVVMILLHQEGPPRRMSPSFPTSIFIVVVVSDYKQLTKDTRSLTRLHTRINQEYYWDVPSKIIIEVKCPLL